MSVLHSELSHILQGISINFGFQIIKHAVIVGGCKCLQNNLKTTIFH